MLLELLDLDDASGGEPRQRFDRFLKTHIFYPSRAHRTLRHWVGGVGMLTFMLTCVTCTSYVTSMGWGDGDVNVHVNLRHGHIVRYFTGLGGGDVNVHVNLHHMHIRRYVTGLVGWGC